MNYFIQEAKIVVMFKSVAYIIEHSGSNVTYLNTSIANIDKCEDPSEYSKLCTEIVDTLQALSEEFQAYERAITVDSLDNITFRDDNYYLTDDYGMASSVPIPDALVAKLQKAIDTENATLPIIKLWTRILRIPNLTQAKIDNIVKYISASYVDEELYNSLIEQGLSPQAAKPLATYDDVSITQHGALATKKYAKFLSNARYNADTQEIIDRNTGEAYNGDICNLRLIPAIQGNSGDAFTANGEYVKGIDDSVNPEGTYDSYEGHIFHIGDIVALDSWDKVNTNDHKSCVPGLHLGGYRYCEQFKAHDRVLLNCIVDPMNIGAVCVKHDGDGALRCKEYYVQGYAHTKTKGFYTESEYAKMCDEEYKKQITAAIQESEAQLNMLKGELNLLNNAENV